MGDKPKVTERHRELAGKICQYRISSHRVAELLAEFEREVREKATETEHIRCLKVFEQQIYRATGPTGGWLISPKTLFSEVALFLLNNFAQATPDPSAAGRIGQREKAE